jgi:hypothetical protein
MITDIVSLTISTEKGLARKSSRRGNAHSAFGGELALLIEQVGRALSVTMHT